MHHQEEVGRWWVAEGWEEEESESQSLVSVSYGCARWTTPETPHIGPTVNNGTPDADCLLREDGYHAKCPHHTQEWLELKEDDIYHLDEGFQYCKCVPLSNIPSPAH